MIQSTHARRRPGGATNPRPSGSPCREEHAEHVPSTLELLHRQQHLAETIDRYRDLVRLAGPDPVAAGVGVRAHGRRRTRGGIFGARGTAWTCC